MPIWQLEVTLEHFFFEKKQNPEIIGAILERNVVCKYLIQKKYPLFRGVLITCNPFLTFSKTLLSRVLIYPGFFIKQPLVHVGGAAHGHRLDKRRIFIISNVFEQRKICCSKWQFHLEMDFLALIPLRSIKKFGV